MKVVWICAFNNSQLSSYLPIKTSLAHRIYCWFNHIPIQKEIFEYAVWNTNGIKEMEKLDDLIELHIISPYPRLAKKIISFNHAGIHYNFFRYNGHVENILFSKFSFWGKPKYRSNRCAIKQLVNKIKPDIIHCIGAENPEYSLSVLDVPVSIPVFVQLQTLMMAPDFEKNYSPKLEKMILNEYKDLYLFYQWTQFEFINEWNKLKQYAHKNDISIIGDIPIYLAYDSSDVWYNPDLFLLDKNKEMIYISACVPDGFNPDGQLWCNPIYDYNYMKKDNYAWWRKRLFNSLALYDILRIDHFRGFDRFYMVENGSINAKDGSWKDGPKEELFKDILDKNIIVEDLCVMDDGVRRLLKNVKYPGMRILEEAFDGNKNNIHKPSNNNANYVLYTETHDGIPVMGLLNTLSEERKEIFVNDLIEERNKLSLKTKKLKKDKDIIDSMIELAYKSSAKYVIIPVQDLLYQDENYRMNLPGVIGKNNWSYRILPNELKSKAAKKLRKYGEKYQR